MIQLANHDLLMVLCSADIFKMDISWIKIIFGDKCALSFAMITQLSQI